MNHTIIFDLGIYVPDDINETQLVLNRINESIENDFHAIRSHTVFATTNFNARCPYCFENGVAKKNMSEQTARDVAEYILSNQGEAKKLYVIWFGGEPMLNVKAADTIAATIKSSISNDVEFRSSMYTKGYLFSEEAIEHAICYWNLKAAQITLDNDLVMMRSILPAKASAIILLNSGRSLQPRPLIPSSTYKPAFSHAGFNCIKVWK